MGRGMLSFALNTLQSFVLWPLRSFIPIVLYIITFASVMH